MEKFTYTTISHGDFTVSAQMPKLTEEEQAKIEAAAKRAALRQLELAFRLALGWDGENQETSHGIKGLSPITYIT